MTSVLGILLALLGYGVALAVQGRFGVPHSTLFGSTLDLFNLGGWAVVQIALSIRKDLASWSFYADLWQRTWPITVTVVCMTLVGALLAWVARLTWKRFGLRALRFLFLADLDPESPNARARRSGVITAAVVGLGFFIVVGTPILMTLCAIAVAVLCVGLVFIPGMAITAGQSYIDEWVVGPKICFPLMDRDRRIQPPLNEPKAAAASCVVITRGTAQIAKGRVVFATPNAIVLYNPATGTVSRVSTDGSTVEVVGEL